MKRKMWAGVGFLALIVVLGAGQSALKKAAAAQAQKPGSGGAPRFDVDPFWPKPLPNNWLLGEISGVYVDAQDRIWIINRPRTLANDQKGAALNPPTSECCVPAPPVVEFDAAGNVVQAWGGEGPGYKWPENEHGIFVDYKGNVWIGGNGAKDTEVLKFTNNGKFLLQIGHMGKVGNANDTENLNKAANMYVYPKTNELFVSDGYGGRRVIVFDADTGKFKRQWGAYGNKVDDGAPRTRVYDGPGPQQFNLVHQVRMSGDDLLYVCDRVNNRIQVFTPDGKFIKEGFIARKTLDSRGTAFEVAFSPDKQQQFVYVPDGSNDQVRILNRDTLQVLSSFGRQGPYAGQWHWLHSIASDSKGNIYTGESRGGRLQKFVYKGASSTSSSR